MATADDGHFDGTTDNYNLLVNDLSAGMYTLEVAGLDSAGNVSDQVARQQFSVFDAIDGSLNTDLHSPGVLLTGQTSPVSGVAYDMAGDTVTKAEYRFNGGDWQPLTTQDGAFDSSYEPFDLPLNTGELSPGTYLVEARAFNSTGQVETNFATMQLTVAEQPFFVVHLPLVIK